MSERSDIKLLDLSPGELSDLFPEAKLTLKDRIPTSMLLLYTILNINKAIKDIKFSEAEIREAILSLVAMVPDELRDEEFNDEIKKATKIIEIDVRPVFCEQKASVEYCQRKGIPITQSYEQVDYFALYHACFNLLMRRNMYLKRQPKEIMTGRKARGGHKDYEPPEEESDEPEV